MSLLQIHYEGKVINAGGKYKVLLIRESSQNTIAYVISLAMRDFVLFVRKKEVIFLWPHMYRDPASVICRAFHSNKRVTISPKAVEGFGERTRRIRPHEEEPEWEEIFGLCEA